MKTYATIILITLMGLIGFSQNGINYKAIVKDDNGNMFANQDVTIRFSILKGDAQTHIYAENHSATTSANGLIVANIGEGMPSIGSFDDIDWGSDSHYLKIEVNTGSGLIDMGTTAFKVVPYALNAANVSGLEAIDEGNGVGWRLKGVNLANHGNIGRDAVDLSRSDTFSTSHGATGDNSRAFGSNVEASGYGAIAIGNNSNAFGIHSTVIGTTNIAEGENSTAIGGFNEAIGLLSIALGTGSKASGDYSVSTGYNSDALGNNSFAMGRFTIASSYASTVIGSHNHVIGSGGNPTFWVATDPLFQIGNGSSSNNKSTALTVLKNGNVGISIASPQVKLQILNGSDASLSGGTGYMVIGNQGSSNLVFDNNEIMARNNGSTSPLYLQHDGGSVYVGGSVVHSSDARLKRNIKSLAYGLDEILKLNPKSYFWKNNQNQKQRSLGLIAQDVQPILKELVLTNTEDDYLSVNYTELIPVLINAIKDQQKIIDRQQKIINSENQKNIKQQKQLETLLVRVKRIESNISQ